MLNNGANAAKSLLHNYVNATLGFQKLGTIVDKKLTGLMRILSDKGNPSLTNISQLRAPVRAHGGVDLYVSAK